MAWATHYIAKLQLGETVRFRPRGHSMAPKVNDGDLVTVRPLVDGETPPVGAIVLCKVSGSQYLHLVKAVSGPRFQIGNNRGGINGWITRSSIYGLCTAVQP